MSFPSVSFEHLFRLSDDTGLLGRARGAVPRRESGYCLDDVARGLVALSREPDPTPAQVVLAGRYLSFVAHAQIPSGACHNRFGYDRRWEDRAGTGDWWGRSLWALGSVVSGNGPQWQRTDALARFEVGCQCRSRSTRTTAFAALGCAEVLAAIPGHAGARHLLTDSIAPLGRPRPDDRWPWPEDRLTYANAVIPEALIAAGRALGDGGAVDDGLRLLSWLVDVQSAGDHLSLVPTGGWGAGEPRPGFDQRPVEAAALADACARAFVVTGDAAWRVVVARCVDWFFGSNDANASMHDPGTGGGYDGLEATGPILDQGAEATLAWLLTLQHGREMAVPDAEEASDGWRRS